MAERATATALRERLFPDGLAFLTLAHKAQWAEGDKRLKQVDGEGHAASLEALVGAPFLAEVRAAQQLYGEVLGLLAAPAEVVEAAAVREPLLALRRALRSYALQVVAAADEDDATSASEVRKQLAPIDEARAPRGRTVESATATESPAASDGD